MLVMVLMIVLPGTVAVEVEVVVICVVEVGIDRHEQADE